MSTSGKDPTAGTKLTPCPFRPAQHFAKHNMSTQPTAEPVTGTSENPITVDSTTGTKRDREPETEAAPAADAAAEEAQQPKIDEVLKAGAGNKDAAAANGDKAVNAEAGEEAPSTKKRKVEAEEAAPAAQNGVRLCSLSCDRASRG